MPSSHRLPTRAGFTLIEILLVVAAIAILAGIVILAVNPSKQLGVTHNAQRYADINTLLNAIYQYEIDNTGSLPSAIATGTTCSTAAQQICKSGGTCTGITDLSVLTTSEKYLTSIPYDPTASTTNGTGYYVYKSSNNRVTVCAPNAEEGATITATR